jgi:hypothetical protein
MVLVNTTRNGTFDKVSLSLFTVSVSFPLDGGTCDDDGGGGGDVSQCWCLAPGGYRTPSNYIELPQLP